MNMFLRSSKKFAASAVSVCFLASFLAGAGCGSGARDTEARAQLEQEVATLRETNQELQHLRDDNKDLPKLRRDNEELKRLREQSKDLAQLHEENNRLRGEIQAAKAPKPKP